MRGIKYLDVVIVGAGPAGASAASVLAGQGFEVLVIERRPWPRLKLCGGGLTPKSWRILGSDVEWLVKRKCDGVNLRAGNVGPFHLRSNDVSVWMVDRRDLDVWLLEKAQAKGAQFVDGQAVRVLEQMAEGVRVVTENGAWHGRVVIGADGVDSVIAKQAGLRNDRSKKYFLALQTEVRSKADSLETTAIVDFGLRYGYAWAFPKGEHYSIGVGTCDQRLFKDLPKQLDRFIVTSGFGDDEKTAYRGHKLPFGGAKERLHNGNVVLVGDAAGLVDPLFGEGISYALKSGELAAKAIGEYLNGKTGDLGGYTDSIHRTVLKDLQSLRNIAFFVHRFPGLAVRLLSSSRSLQDIVAATISGDRSHLNRSD